MPLRYLNYQVYTNEIPDELSLGFTILGCNVHCPECHSKHVWDINSKDIGHILTRNKFLDVCYDQDGITCILFFGGEWEPDALMYFLGIAKDNGFRTALYTGRTLEYMDKLNNDYQNGIYKSLDYLKVGPYIPEAGPIICSKTNQRLFKLKSQIVKYDITEKFWK